MDIRFRSPVRLMHGYFFRPVDDRRNGNENIVHDSREQKGKGQNPQHHNHVFYLSRFAMQVEQGPKRISQFVARLSQSFLIVVPERHIMNSRSQAIRRDSR